MSYILEGKKFVVENCLDLILQKPFCRIIYLIAFQ